MCTARHSAQSREMRHCRPRTTLDGSHFPRSVHGRCPSAHAGARSRLPVVLRFPGIWCLAALLRVLDLSMVSIRIAIRLAFLGYSDVAWSSGFRRTISQELYSSHRTCPSILGILSGSRSSIRNTYPLPPLSTVYCVSLQHFLGAFPPFEDGQPACGEV